MALADELGDYPAADEPQYTPRTEFDGRTGFIQTGPTAAQVGPDFKGILTEFGYDPDKVMIAGHPRVSKWQQRARNRETGEYETVWLTAYRFHIAPINDRASSGDLEAIVLRARAERRPANGPHWFVFQAGDTQLGKRSRDGSTEQIVERYIESIETAKVEFANLKRHGIEGIQISLPGDCIEGNQSQSQKNLWLTQETITEQVTILRRLMMYTVGEFAPLTERVFLDVVNGNHDEAQRTQNTYSGDGWATHAATSVADALTHNPLAFGHVTVRVPDKWSGFMTVPVGDTVVTVAHGHQWRTNQAMKWWSEQALHHQPPGGAHILQNGHYHSWQVETTERRTRIQSPTFDCGSDWYRERRGATSRRGGLVYLLRAGEPTRMTLV